MLTEIKRPEIGPNADELTSLTRGRGPRRGNLEALLRYWRPIMKKPGGFRRCLVILANHPELYPLERICAWLHHETTGKWPNEGKKKRTGRSKRNVRRRRRRKLTRSVRRGTRRKKSVDFTENIVEVSALRLAIRESRDIGGILTQPIGGRQNAVDLKAAMFNQYSMTLPVEGEVKRVGIVGSRSRAGQAVQGVGSIILPGDISDIRSPIRSQIYETLTPGGGRSRRPSARRLLRGAGRGARNKFRCPPGFQKGGTFTNREFSTCGAQVLGIPSVGPGSPSEGAQRALARLARSAELVREIGDLRKNRSSYDIIRAAQIPVAPKKGSATRRQTSVDLVLARIGEQEFGTRLVRRDGVILEPVVSLQALGSMDEFDDMVDGSLVDRYSSGQIGKDLIPAFGAGLRDVYIGIPDTQLVVKVSRDGGELNPTEMDAVQRVYPTSLRRVADLPDPSASIYALSEVTNGRFDVEVGELKNNRFQKTTDTKNERIRVQSGRQILMVPRWVYETFLSRSAPRRAKGDPIFEMVESNSKSVNPFMISTKSALEVANKDAGYHDAIEMRTALFADSRVSAHTEIKRIGRRAATPNVNPARQGGRARAIFDPNIDGFRCPPGTRNAGQFSDQFGRNCGYSLPRTLVNNLVDVGMKIEDAMDRRRLRREERGSVRERLGAAYRERLAKVEDGLAKVMDRLADVLDVTEDRNLGRIGPTLEQRRRRADLTPEQKELLEGGDLRDALQNMQNVLEERDFDNADITDVRKAFKQVEKAAQLEAGRLTDNPARNRNQRNMRARIQETISKILDRLANLIDDRTDRRGNRRDRRDGVDAPRADLVPDRRRRGTPARRVRNTDAIAPDVNARNRGNRLGRRNTGIDVPELRELDDGQKSRVNRAIQNEYNDLGDYWARLLGVDEPTDVEIRRYLRRDRRNNQGNDRRVKERRYRDWLELNEVLQKIDNGDEDIDYEDFVGRLAPNRRDSVVSKINPPERPRRQRRDAAPDANVPDANVPDAAERSDIGQRADILQTVAQFGDEDWAVQSESELDDIIRDLEGRRRVGGDQVSEALNRARLERLVRRDQNEINESKAATGPQSAGDIVGNANAALNRVNNMTVMEDLDDDELEEISTALNLRLGQYQDVQGGPPPPSSFTAALTRVRNERQRRRELGDDPVPEPLNDREERVRNAIKAINDFDSLDRLSDDELRQNVGLLIDERDRRQQNNESVSDVVEAFNLAIEEKARRRNANPRAQQGGPLDADAVDERIAEQRAVNAIEAVEAVNDLDLKNKGLTEVRELQDAVNTRIRLIQARNGDVPQNLLETKTRLRAAEILLEMDERHQIDRPIGDRDLSALRQHQDHLNNLLQAPIDDPQLRNFIQRQNQSRLDEVNAEIVNREQQISQLRSASSGASSDPSRMRNLLDRVAVRKKGVQRRQDKMDEMAERFWGDERPFELGRNKTEARRVWAGMSRDDRDEFMRNMFLHGKEVDLGTFEHKGKTYRKSYEMNVNRIAYDPSTGLPTNTSGNAILRLRDENGNVVKEQEFTGYPQGGFSRYFSSGTVTHSSFGIAGPVRFTDQDGEDVSVNFNTGGGGAATFNSNAYNFYKGLGFSNVKVGTAAGDGQAAWAVGGYRSPDTSVKRLNSPGRGMGRLLDDYDSYRVKIANGEYPSSKEILARMRIGDDERAERVRFLFDNAQGVPVGQMPDHADYNNVLKPEGGVNSPFYNFLRGSSVNRGMDKDAERELLAEINAELPSGGTQIGTNFLESNGEQIDANVGSGVMSLSDLKLPSNRRLARRRRERAEEAENLRINRAEANRPPAGPFTQLELTNQKALNPDAANNRLNAGNTRGIPVPLSSSNAPQNLRTQDGAIEHLRNNGSVSEIPDEFVLEAIASNSERFESLNWAREAGAVNSANTRFYKDRVTGKIYGAKYVTGTSSFPDEGYREVMGAQVARHFGFNQGQFRFISPNEVGGLGGGANPSPAILFEAHQFAFGDGVDSPLNARGGQVFPRVDVNQQVGALLLDAVLLNKDRHARNWLFAGDPDNGDAVYLPVDHGALRVNDQILALSPEDRMTAWFNGRNIGGQLRHSGDSRSVQNRSRDELREAVVTFQESARQRAEAAGSLESNLGEIIEVGGGMSPASEGVGQIRQSVEQNFQFLLEADPDAVVNLLLSGI